MTAAVQDEPLLVLLHNKLIEYLDGSGAGLRMRISTSATLQARVPWGTYPTHKVIASHSYHGSSVHSDVCVQVGCNCG